MMRCRLLALFALSFSSHLLQAGLIADVTATAGPSVWSYTLLNNESADSSFFISSFILTVNAPVTVVATPAGWDFSTDNATFVFWFDTDPVLPYPDDVAPSSSLGGFSVSSTASFSELLSYGLSGWDHTLDQPGPTTDGTVLAPSESAPTSIPEPNSLILTACCPFAYLAWRWVLVNKGITNHRAC
jgi:hypothetical protein